MKALIDADIVSFSCAAYNNDFGWDACREDIDQLMRRILETTGATEYAAYLTGSNNFRYNINPEYKANRKGKVDPVHRQDANAYLVTEYGALVTDGIEADDALGIDATKHGSDTIVCSIDKDLLTIPGQHYNWRRNEFRTVSNVDALRWFYRQLLIGDTADNLFGVRGIGDKKSAGLINNVNDEIDMFEIVQALYNDDTRLLMNGQCMWLLREEGRLWSFPSEQTIPSEEEPGSL